MWTFDQFENAARKFSLLASGCELDQISGRDNNGVRHGPTDAQCIRIAKQRGNTR